MAHDARPVPTTPAHDADPARTRTGDGGPGRRAVLGGSVLAAAGIGAGLTSSSATAGGHGHHRPPGHGERRNRAHRAVAALAENFDAPTDPDMLSENFPRKDDDPEFTFCWPLSQTRAAVSETADAYGRVPHDLSRLIRRLARAQEQYWISDDSPAPVPGYTAATDSDQGANGDIYYDDNAWVVLHETEELLVTYGRRGNRHRARQLVELARAAESTDPDVPHPGGLFWYTGGEGRNTVSTVPNAKAALRLFQITGEKGYLTDAVRWVDWTRSTLQDSGNGLFWDNIGKDGSYDKTYWAYNQGVPLGTEALLFQITSKRKHRDRAIELYDAIVDHWSVFDGGAGFDDEPLQFAAILMANLVMAEAIIGPRIAGRKIASRLADILWDERRDPDTDLYDGEKREGDGDRIQLLDQAGFARSLAIAATPHRTARWLG